MLRLLIDEDFNGDILAGLRRRLPSADLPRVQELGLSGTPDADLLEFAWQQRRVVVTHDANTMTAEVLARLAAGRETAGLIVVPQAVPLKLAVAELAYVAEAAVAEDFVDPILYLPLK